MAAQQGIITVNGYLGGNPIRIGQSDTTVSVFTMATTPGFRNQQTGQWVDMPTTWLRVKAFRSLAENVLRSLRKGDPVIVTGQIGTEQWTGKDGGAQSSMVITATNIGHDLNTGCTLFTKTTQTRRDSATPRENAGSREAAPAQMGADPHEQPQPMQGQPQPMQQEAVAPAPAGQEQPGQEDPW